LSYPIEKGKQYKRTYSQTTIHNITTFVSTETKLKNLLIKNYIWLTTYYKEMISLLYHIQNQNTLPMYKMNDNKKVFQSQFKTCTIIV
jgi:hypothetical protein